MSLPVSVDSILPSFDWNDENKRKYLSYRVCGFNRSEARERAGVTWQTVKRWINADSGFREIEVYNLSELRKKYSKEFLRLDYIRNLKLFLDKDLALLNKSLAEDHTKPITMLTKEEWNYLRAARGHYSAKELNSLDDILGDFGGGDWDELLIMARKDGSKEGKGDTISTFRSSKEYTESTLREIESTRKAAEEDYAKEDIDG